MPQSAEGARELLDRVIAAKGGLEKLRGIKSIKAVTTSDMPDAAGRRRRETTTYLQYPNRVRVETKLPDVDDRAGVRRATRGVKDPHGVHDVPERAIRDLRGELQARHAGGAARGAGRPGARAPAP